MKGQERHVELVAMHSEKNKCDRKQMLRQKCSNLQGKKIIKNPKFSFHFFQLFFFLIFHL